ncbi:unnamed protein product [Ectocarpus fasciculatus]
MGLAKVPPQFRARSLREPREIGRIQKTTFKKPLSEKRSQRIFIRSRNQSYSDWNYLRTLPSTSFFGLILVTCFAPSVFPRKVSTITVHRGRLDPVGMEVTIELPNP